MVKPAFHSGTVVAVVILQRGPKSFDVTQSFRNAFVRKELNLAHDARTIPPRDYSCSLAMKQHLENMKQLELPNIIKFDNVIDAGSPRL